MNDRPETPWMWRVARQGVRLVVILPFLLIAPVLAAEDAPSRGDGATTSPPAELGDSRDAPASPSAEEGGKSPRSSRERAPLREDGGRSVRPDGGCLYRERELELIV